MAATQSFLMTVFIRPKNLQHIYVDSWKISEHSRCHCYENIHKQSPACFFLCSVCLIHNLATDPKPCWRKWHQNSFYKHLESFTGSHGGAADTSDLGASMKKRVPTLKNFFGESFAKKHRSIFRSVKQYLIYTLHVTQTFSI